MCDIIDYGHRDLLSDVTKDQRASGESSCGVDRDVDPDVGIGLTLTARSARGEQLSSILLGEPNTHSYHMAMGIGKTRHRLLVVFYASSALKTTQKQTCLNSLFTTR